jgi:hypothetical protein
VTTVLVAPPEDDDLWATGAGGDDALGSVATASSVGAAVEATLDRDAPVDPASADPSEAGS